MNRFATRFIRFSAGLIGILSLAWVLTSQAAKPAQLGMPLPTDWSHHHLIFSRPRSPEQLAEVQRDPRYWQQLYRRNVPLALPVPDGSNSASNAHELNSFAQSTRRIHRDWSESLGTGATVGGENFPMKFSFSSTTANCGTDYVVFSTGLNGSSGQANIVAFNNLYSGCGGTVPSVYWAYNITDAHLASGKILTSPVPSLDGSQIAFVQDNGLSASLILLKWAASTTESVSFPSTPNSVSNSSYRACPALPCFATLDLRSGIGTGTATRDTTSSVFYDYTGDIAWVGDSQGWLHQFTGVFKGTPAEVRTGGFPVQVPAGAVWLSSPVFDRISKTVFVGDNSGFLNRVDVTNANVTQSGQLDFGTGIVDAPMVDVTRGQVYASASDDGSLGCASGAADCAGIYQLSASFATGDTGTEAVVGTATVGGSPSPNPLYDGTVDNAYLNSANATGNLYVCGNTGANPILYVVPIQAGILGTPAVISTLATAGSTPACSPVTDISAPGATVGSAATEHLFVSVQGNSTAAACSGGGCIQNLIDTPWQGSTSFTAGQEILVKSSSPLSRFINVVITAGTTGTTQPSWPSTAGVTRADGGVVWLCQGNTNTPILGWVANHSYSIVDTRVLDSNGNVEVVKVAGTSGSSVPIWATVPGATTTDNTVTWINAGAFPKSALAAAGGTSGIIIDNTVSPATLAGASQVYFSTLADQTCATSGGTGGCAVQASQSALQ